MMAFIKSHSADWFVMISTTETEVAEVLADHLAIIYKGDLDFID